MKKKLNEKAGFTLVEMLAATVILILLTMMLGTGLNMTMNSYRKIIAQSEVDLLLSTTMDALADDLRFAQDVEEFDDTDDHVSYVPFTYVSDSFKGKIHLELDGETGQIMARNTDLEFGDTIDGKIFLSTGAYGVGEPDKERAYRVSVMRITPDIYVDSDTNTKTGIFTIHLEVQATADPSITAEGEITVRCLNKYDIYPEENGI